MEWVSNEEFVAGYGAAQAVPEPLFTFAAYLGAVMHRPSNGIAGAAIALVAIFLPNVPHGVRGAAVLERAGRAPVSRRRSEASTRHSRQRLGDIAHGGRHHSGKSCEPRRDSAHC
jgi:hypothetical protein